MYANYNKKNTTPTRGENAIKGVITFIKSKNLHEDDLDTVLIKYRHENDIKSLERVDVCNEIQKDFSKFVKWFKKTYK